MRPTLISAIKVVFLCMFRAKVGQKNFTVLDYNSQISEVLVYGRYSIPGNTQRQHTPPGWFYQTDFLETEGTVSSKHNGYGGFGKGSSSPHISVDACIARPLHYTTALHRPPFPLSRKASVGFLRGAGHCRFRRRYILYFMYENNGNMRSLSDRVIRNNTGTATRCYHSLLITRPGSVR